jgi:hypothetical protein
MHIDSLHIGMTDYIGIVMTMMVQPISICSYKNALSYLETMVTTLKQKKRNVHIIRARNQNQRKI